MLPNEVFALNCLSRYEQMGIVVGKHNGEFAHCPLPKGMGDKGYYLLHDDHQHQGLLQSKDVGRCCFLNGNAKRWLTGCKEFPENYFELWDIYDEFKGENAERLHKKKDEFGRSIQGVKNAERLHAEKDEFGRSVRAARGAEKAHAKKDELGRSVLAVKNVEKAHAKKDELGRSIQGVKNAERLHAEKDEFGRSVHAVKGAEKAHAKKDELGRSVQAVKAGKSNKLKTQKKIELVRIVDERVFIYDSLMDADRELGLDFRALSAVCLGKRKTHKGFTARYLT